MDAPSSVELNVDTSSIDNVFKALIEELSVENAMLSSAVAKTAGWKQEENKITATIGSQFELMQLRNGASLISGFLSKVYGRTMAFEVTIEEHRSFREEEESLPMEVQILRDTFKGSVISLK